MLAFAQSREPGDGAPDLATSDPVCPEAEYPSFGSFTKTFQAAPEHPVPLTFRQFWIKLGYTFWLCFVLALFCFNTPSPTQ